MLSHFSQRFLQSGRPLLLSDGWPESFVDELAQQCLREVEGRTPYYILLEHVYAKRR
jgi:hypothetical protein